MRYDQRLGVMMLLILACSLGLSYVTYLLGKNERTRRCADDEVRSIPEYDTVGPYFERSQRSFDGGVLCIENGRSWTERGDTCHWDNKERK